MSLINAALKVAEKDPSFRRALRAALAHKIASDGLSISGAIDQVLLDVAAHFRKGVIQRYAALGEFSNPFLRNHVASCEATLFLNDGTGHFTFWVYKDDKHPRISISATMGSARSFTQEYAFSEFSTPKGLPEPFFRDSR